MSDMNRSPSDSMPDGRTLRLYSDGDPTTPYGAGALAMADELARRTNGRLRIEPVLGFAAAGEALGPQRAQGRGMIEAVRSGDADLAILSAAALGDLIPEMLVLDLPFLFDSPEQARAAIDGPGGQRLLAALPACGLVGLAWGETGMRHITTTSRPVRGPADLAGLVVRVQENPLHREIFAELGARPVSMPVLAEVIGGLRDGRLDAQENNLWIMPIIHIEEVQRHLSLTGHIYQAVAFLMSPQAEAQLLPGDREALSRSAQAGVAVNRAVGQKADAAALALLRQAGVEVEEQPDREAFRTALEPVWARWRARFDPTLFTELAPER